MNEIIFDRNRATLICQKETPKNRWDVLPDRDQLYGMRQNRETYYFLYHADAWDSPRAWEPEEEPATQISHEEARRFFAENARPGDYGIGHDFNLL